MNNSFFFERGPGPNIEQYITPAVDISYLMQTIEKTPLLKTLAEKNKSFALIRAYYFDLAKKVGDTAYYPGIGGGDEPLDPFSAFDVLGVDHVIGIDLQTSKDPSDWRVDTGLQRAAKDERNGVTIFESDESWGRFLYKGKVRTLRVMKGDATQFVPEFETPIIYQKRETSLIARLPKKVIDGTRLVACSDDNAYIPKAAASFALRNGLSPINLHNLYQKLDEGRNQINTYWDGNPQLMVRQNV